MDASQAGEGQLEISINDGEVPNHVQVLGGGRCLVSFTPDTAKIHTIDIKVTFLFSPRATCLLSKGCGQVTIHCLVTIILSSSLFALLFKVLQKFEESL